MDDWLLPTKWELSNRFAVAEQSLKDLMRPYRLANSQVDVSVPFLALANESRLWKVFDKNGVDIYPNWRTARGDRNFMRSQVSGSFTDGFAEEILADEDRTSAIIKLILNEDFLALQSMVYLNLLYKNLRHFLRLNFLY